VPIVNKKFDIYYVDFPRYTSLSLPWTIAGQAGVLFESERSDLGLYGPILDFEIFRVSSTALNGTRCSPASGYKAAVVELLA
jgi:hypothetical protein